jgi:hypothetical protein
MSKNSRARPFCALGGLRDLVTKNLDFLVKFEKKSQQKKFVTCQNVLGI